MFCLQELPKMISKLQIELLKEKADIAEIRLKTVDTDLTEVDTKGPTAPKVIGFLVHCKTKYSMFTLHVYRPGGKVQTNPLLDNHTFKNNFRQADETCGHEREINYI